MLVSDLAIPDVKVLKPKLHHDDRGYVCETLRSGQMRELGIDVEFVQENLSSSLRRGTVRGLHAQAPEKAQAKLVRVLRGSILDIAVDIRRGSKTYGQHIAHTLTEREVEQLYVPKGFLHGFCTLEDDTVVLYKMSSFYAPGSEIGAVWNDPDLEINWPVDPAKAIVSGKDLKLPRLKDLEPRTWS